MAHRFLPCRRHRGDSLEMSEDASLPNTVRQEALKTYRRIHEK